MYNRYIPQPDGTYQRSRVQDQSRAPDIKKQPPAQRSFDPPVTNESACCAHCGRNKPVPPPIPPKLSKNHHDGSITGFLKQLIPIEFELEDLMVVLLLLLMSGDCKEDQNTALLTLVLYLFL